jgi:magnesium-transporting ATPase (P-type)
VATRVTASTQEANAFQAGVNKVSWLLIRFAFVMVPLVLLINGFTKGNWSEAFLFALSVAVGLTPEMLPMIVTSTLAKGGGFIVAKKGHRQAPRCDPEFRRHECAVHRQDRPEKPAGPRHAGTGAWHHA